MMNPQNIFAIAILIKAISEAADAYTHSRGEKRARKTIKKMARRQDWRSVRIGDAWFSMGEVPPPPEDDDEDEEEE